MGWNLKLQNSPIAGSEQGQFERLLVFELVESVYSRGFRGLDDEIFRHLAILPLSYGAIAT